MQPVTSLNVKVCGCRPHDGGAAHTGGRRTQTFTEADLMSCFDDDIEMFTQRSINVIMQS